MSRAALIQVSISKADALPVNESFTLRVWHALAVLVLVATGGVIGGAMVLGTDEPTEVVICGEARPSRQGNS